MQFLAPLFLAALAALSVPILMHIQRRRPRERMTFSAVRFLDANPPVRRRHLRLQDILLLLLRCLAIAFIVFAFTRPFFAGGHSLGAGDGVRHAILVDTSASMRGERFAEAKRAAERIVAGAAPGDRIAVAAFDDELRVALPFESSVGGSTADRKAAAVAAIRALEPGWRSTNLGAALIGAADVVEQEREVSGDSPAEIHVVSDLQRTAVTDDLPGFSWPPRLRIVPVPIGGEDWTNAGLHIDAPADGPPRLRISNSTGSAAEDFQVAWESASAQSVRVLPGASETLAVREPGASVDLRGDPFEFDNRAWIAPATEFSVTVDYLGTAAPDDSKDSLFYLGRALSAATNPSVALRVNPTNDAGPAALTIIDGPLEAAQARTLREALERGGNALLVLRGPEMRETFAILGDIETTIAEVTPERPELLGRIDFDDSVFAPFSDPRYSNFSPIATWRYRKMDVPPAAKALASFSSGDPALLRAPAGRGTLFVLTTSWRPDDSQLALSSKFAPLLMSMLAEADEFAPPNAQVHVGQPVRLPRAASRDIRLPDGRTVSVAGDTFRDTTEPGLYRTTDDRFVFAVNPPPAETDLTPLASAALRALGLPLEAGSIPKAATDSAPAIHWESESRQKWWRWLILAAILLLVMESAVAAWSSRNRPLTP